MDSSQPSEPYQKLRLLVVYVRMTEHSYYSSTDMVYPEQDYVDFVLFKRKHCNDAYIDFIREL